MSEFSRCMEAESLFRFLVSNGWASSFALEDVVKGYLLEGLTGAKGWLEIYEWACPGCFNDTIDEAPRLFEKWEIDLISELMEGLEDGR